MRLSAVHGLEVDDGRSVLSHSSLGSHSSETVKQSTGVVPSQVRNRKFTAALGKVGYAKEARDAVAKLINRRSPPLAEPVDFEVFVTEFSAELETDSLRDLIVFPRDDVTEKESLTPVGVLREGYLNVDLHGDSFVRNFKGRKRRYCAIRRAADGVLSLEVSKQPDSVKTSFVIKSAHLKTSNKQRTTVLEVVPQPAKDVPEQCLIFPSDSEPDVKAWFQAIDLALKNAPSDTEGDKDSEPSLSETINESLKSAGSSGDHVSQRSVRHTNSVEALLKPPVVKRKNLFSLYENVEPMPRPQGETSALLEDPDDELKLCNIESGLGSESKLPSELCNGTQHCHSISTEITRIVIKCNRLGITMKTEDGPEQVEPFFVHLFFFDLQTGERISEEVPLIITTPEFSLKLKETGSQFKLCIFEKENINFSASLDLPKVSSTTYVVARFERLLSGCPPDVYFKAVVEKKQLSKYQKIISSACQRLSNYKSLFGWAAKHVSLDPDPIEALPVFRIDGRLTDQDLKKMLTDFSKLQKAGKLQPIPGAEFQLKVSVQPKLLDLSLKQLQPLIATDYYRQSTTPAERNLANGGVGVQLSPFADTDDQNASKPLRCCANFLYVYPLALSYASQKNFGRARNIACTTKLVRQRGADPAQPIPAIIDLANGPLVHEHTCPVQYHEQNPLFHDEIKIELPVDLNEGDHLLFSFNHISLANAQKPQNNETIEQSIGTAWLPLLKPDRTLALDEDCQIFDIPVAAQLSPDYFKHDSTLSISSRKSSDHTIKWVDGGKHLFKIRLRLKSALFSSNASVQRFMQQCSDGIDLIDWVAKKESASEVPLHRIQPHLHVVLNSLLQLFTKTNHEQNGVNVLSTLVGILERCSVAGRKQDLREFVKFHCAVGGEFDVDARALYEGLLESVGVMLSNENADQNVVLQIFRSLWFLLDVAAKSMAQAILANGSHKYSRRRRFSALTLEAMETTFGATAQQILLHHQRHPAETKAANVALALFAKHCLNIIDRGSLFVILHDLVKRYDLNDVGLPRHYKFEFLQILVSHEHWLPLNLPMLFDASNKPLLGLAGTKIEEHGQDASLNVDHFQLSKTYCSTHFLVGLLLQEFSAALRESKSYRKLVVGLIRNLLVKHSVDLRYDGAAAQSRIAVLYAPLIQVLMDNVEEFDLFRRFEGKETVDDHKFDYAQSTARSIISKDFSATINNTYRPSESNNNPQRIAAFAEKLDHQEARDLILCALYLLNNLPKQVTVSLAFSPRTNDANHQRKDDDILSVIHLLRLALRLFRCQDQLKQPIGGPFTSLNLKKPSFPGKDQKILSLKQLRKLFIQESHLAQEVALIVLDVSHTLAEYVARRWSGAELDPTQERQLFLGLIQLKLELVGDQWPEAVRLNALNSLGMFIELFATQLQTQEGADALPKLSQRLLLLLNSRLEKVQASAAAILHLLIRQGFYSTYELYTRQLDSRPGETQLPNSGQASAEWLGNPGLQITIGLAYLLGQNELSPDCPRIEHGLNLFESLTANQTDRKLELFKLSAQDLANQLRDILKATISITEARNDPIRLAELHVQLADSYRGSPALRAAWFDTLAQIHSADRWYSEAAVCQAHCIAIIGKQLRAKEKIPLDFSLLDSVNSQIQAEENLKQVEIPLSHGANFTIEALTAKVEETVKVLIQAERYEAVGPIYRLAIPLYEKNFNNKALTSVYADLHQAYSRAAEIQASGKRHLGSYFKVVLHSPLHFREDHLSEWVYREPALTSLAEACERMVQLFRKALSTENVRFLTEHENVSNLDPAVAHIQLVHIEPLLVPANIEKVNFEEHLANTQSPEVNYTAHTNVCRFYYEKPLIEKVDANSNEKVPEQARLSLKRVFVTTDGTFPNTRRRLRVKHKSEEVLNPLYLACENLRRKASQIQRVLRSAGISETGPVERSKINCLDVKGLQCLLQGSVNVGVLAYAEAFTSETQRTKYGVEGLERLKLAFKVFMSQLARALAVNEMAVGQDQTEYQVMLKNSFDGMVERLSTFFDGENFLPDGSIHTPSKTPVQPADTNFRNSAYILDSISGIPDRM